MDNTKGDIALGDSVKVEVKPLTEAVEEIKSSCMTVGALTGAVYIAGMKDPRDCKLFAGGCTVLMMSNIFSCFPLINIMMAAGGMGMMAYAIKSAFGPKPACSVQPQ